MKQHCQSGVSMRPRQLYRIAMMDATASRCLVAGLMFGLFLPLIVSHVTAETTVGYRLVDSFDYAGDKELQAVWQPIHGLGSTSLSTIDGRKALRVRCSFSNGDAPRVSVERSIKLNLSGSQGLQFRIRCADSLSIAKFNIYLHSGAGWYAAAFSVENPAAWNTVIIDKAAMEKEDRPGGWGSIDAIRVSAWRVGNVDTEFFLSDLGLWGENPRIVIVRGDWYARRAPSEAKQVASATEGMAQRLRSIGAEYLICGDMSLNDQTLSGKKLLILPNNKELPGQALEAVRKFLQAGGKLISFYIIPDELRELVGVQQGAVKRQSSPGYFASVRACGKELDGLPSIVEQSSWNIFQSRAIEGKSRVVAYWHTDKGQNTGEPAIIVSENCIHMSHILISDDPAGKRTMLLAMAGHFLPELWQRAARAGMDQAGAFGPFHDRSAFEEFMKKAGSRTNEGLGPLQEEIRGIVATAENLYSSGRFVDAFLAAGEAQQMMIRLYCMAQVPRDNERRAIWCHSPFGVSGMDWDKSIKVLSDNGFTDILVNVCWAGTAYYDSNVLQVSSEVKRRGDQISICLAACRRYGVRFHAWRVCWNTEGQAGPDFTAKMVKAKRTQVCSDGSTKDHWLCPSNPDNQAQEVAAMMEIARKYPVDGIQFDYIRYPDRKCCFCDGCRERFEKVLGRKIRHWPADVMNDHEIRRKWFDFRRHNITAVVAAVSSRVREIRPGISISAAVFSDRQNDRDSVGQDWKLWCDSGYMDFVCPMNYTASSQEFLNLTRRQMVWAGKTPCYPGIGLSVWPPSDRASRLVDQVLISRQLGTGGFAIFNYGLSEAEDVLPLCGLGLTRKK